MGRRAQPTDQKKAAIKMNDEQQVTDALVHQHGLFLSFLNKRLRSREEAEDILAAAYLKGMRKSASIRNREDITAWFFRLLRNVLTDHWRKQASQARAMKGYASEAKLNTPEQDVELEKNICACVKALVKTIKPEYAEAIRKVDLGNSKIVDFARKSGISPGNAAVRVHRARRSLKKRLLETCGACAKHGCLDCTCRKV